MNQSPSCLKTAVMASSNTPLQTAKEAEAATGEEFKESKLNSRSNSRTGSSPSKPKKQRGVRDHADAPHIPHSLHVSMNLCVLASYARTPMPKKTVSIRCCVAAELDAHATRFRQECTNAVDRRLFHTRYRAPFRRENNSYPLAPVFTILK